MKNIYAKLLAIQKEIPPITKEESNPFFKSKYFDVNKLIEVLRPILNKHGVIVMQPLGSIDGKPAIRTIVADTESGEAIEDTTILPEAAKEKRTFTNKDGAQISQVGEDPQKAGSYITYYRRYALQSFFFLQAEDDDANKASNVKATSNRAGQNTQPMEKQTCDKCGAPKKLSQTGTLYCSKLCWKQQPQNPTGQAQDFESFIHEPAPPDDLLPPW